MSKEQFDRWIDFSTTFENIKRLLSITSTDALSKLLFVSEETVRSWRYGKRLPETPKLIILSLLANKDFFDFVGFKKSGSSADEILQILRSSCNTECLSVSKTKRKRWQYESEEDLIQELLFNQYSKSFCPIKSLNEFFLFLPLIPESTLADFYYRVSGEPFNAYLQQKLQDIYHSIPESPAKQYASKYKYYHLEYPVISQIPMNTPLLVEQKKLRDFIEYQNSFEYSQDKLAYNKSLHEFRSKLVST